VDGLAVASVEVFESDRGESGGTKKTLDTIDIGGYRMTMKKVKTDAFLVKFEADQAALIRKTAEELEMTPTELIRSCTTLELARKTGDPAALESVAKMFREGVHEWIQSRVNYEIEKKKKEYEKKRA